MCVQWLRLDQVGADLVQAEKLIQRRATLPQQLLFWQCCCILQRQHQKIHRSDSPSWSEKRKWFLAEEQFPDGLSGGRPAP